LSEPITLDQLGVFLAIVDAGSFSGAARKLARAQSAVSYAIANLERLLELELFDRTGRKPVLTAAGVALVEEARAVDERVDRLLARARQIREGVEPRLAVAVDVFFPMPMLLEVLAAFREQYPTVPVHLRTEALGAVAQLVDDGVVQFGISQPLREFPPGIERSPLTRIELVTVCAAEHPLAASEGPLTLAQLRQHTQLVLTDRSPLTAGLDMAVAGDDNWRLADLPAKLACLRAGFGWGNMPLHMVTDQLDAGQLVRLHVREWGEDPYPIDTCVIYRAASPPGPAGRWLIAALERPSRSAS
jgi:DNA-binding transcriptional LysR family regulator